MAVSIGEMQLRAMFNAFEDGHPAKGSNPREALRAIVQSMPDLQQRMETAAEDGRLKGFAVDGKQKSAATYDSDTGIITLKSVTLADAATEQRALKRQGPNDQAPNERWSNHIRYTLSHEVQHAIDRKELLEQDAALRGQAGALMSSGQPQDYTQLLVDYVEKSRKIEIGAEIAGFNAFADYVQDEKRKKSPGAALTLEDLYNASPSDMKMYIDVRVWESPKYQFKTDLKADESHRLRPVEENFHGMNRHFFEATNYPYTELDRAFGILREMEAQALATARSADPQCEAPTLLVDCAQLRLRPIHLPDGFADRQAKRDAPEPSAVLVPVVESDAGQKKPRIMTAAPDAAMPMPAPAPVTPDRSGHPDHDFYTFLRRQLPGEVPDNAVAHAMSIAKSKGIVDASFVEQGEVAFVPEKREIMIGGTLQARQERVNLPIDNAQSMSLVAEELQAQRSRAAQSASGGSPEVAQLSSLQRH